jgi:hypothetical protein
MQHTPAVAKSLMPFGESDLWFLPDKSDGIECLINPTRKRVKQTLRRIRPDFHQSWG